MPGRLTWKPAHELAPRFSATGAARAAARIALSGRSTFAARLSPITSRGTIRRPRGLVADTRSRIPATHKRNAHCAAWELSDCALDLRFADFRRVTSKPGDDCRWILGTAAEPGTADSLCFRPCSRRLARQQRRLHPLAVLGITRSRAHRSWTWLHSDTWPAKDTSRRLTKRENAAPYSTAP